MMRGAAMTRLLLVPITSAALLGGVAHAQPARQLTFESAIELSLGKNPDIAVAKEAIAGAEAKTAGLSAKRYPSVSADARGNLYTEPYQVDFGGALFTLHKQETSFTTVMISQPLTGLAYLSALVGAAEHAANATRDDYDRVRLDTAYRTAEAYLHVLEARAGAEVAHRSVADTQSGLDQAIVLRKADTYTDIDVLRFQSAKAAADRAALRADTAAQTALAGLVVQLGLHDGDAIAITDDLPTTAPPLAMTLAQAQDRALAARPELRGARERIAVATAQRESAREKYLPDVRAVGVWAHATGVEPFQPDNEEYVGLHVSWNVWDWGSTHQGVVEAEHARARAQLASDALADRVRLEVRQRWLAAKTAYDSQALADTQAKAAEEAYRLQKVKLDNAAATATDVLDAETEVARARLQIALARYDYYLALVALARSVGDLPHPQIR
jgi:outer membrane protein